jgi:hypothetical protein
LSGTTEDVIPGVVTTFADITAAKAVVLREEHEQLRWLIAGKGIAEL